MKSWLTRAVGFVASMSKNTDKVTVNSCEADPPMAIADLKPFMRASRQEFPEQIVTFLTTASSSCRCSFSARGQYILSEEEQKLWPSDQSLPARTFTGGAEICNLEHFAKWMDAYQYVPDEYQEDWHDSFIFMAFKQFDFLGLDLSYNDADPPVVLLSHEEFAPTEIAPNFQSFLERWESVGYLNPMLFYEFGFIDPDTDEFDPSPDAIDRLHLAFPMLKVESA